MPKAYEATVINSRDEALWNAKIAVVVPQQIQNGRHVSKSAVRSNQIRKGGSVTPPYAGDKSK